MTIAKKLFLLNNKVLPPTFGPQAFYTLDNWIGTTVTDETSDGNNGTTAGSPLAVAGKFGDGIQLNADTKRIDLPAVLKHGTLPFSFACWVKWDGTADRGAIIHTADWNFYVGGYWGAAVEITPTGEILAGFGGGGNTSADYNKVTTTNTLVADTWTHYAVNIKGKDDYDVWWDGALLGAGNKVYDGTETGILAGPAGAPHGCVGASLATDFTVNSVLDDILIRWEGLLTQADVNALVAGTFTP